MFPEDAPILVRKQHFKSLFQNYWNPIDGLELPLGEMCPPKGKLLLILLIKIMSFVESLHQCHQDSAIYSLLGRLTAILSH